MSRWKLHLPTLSLGRAVDGATQLGSLRWAESSFWAENWDSKAVPNGQKKKLSQNDHGDGSKRMAQDRREIDSACLVVKNHVSVPNCQQDWQVYHGLPTRVLEF